MKTDGLNIVELAPSSATRWNARRILRTMRGMAGGVSGVDPALRVFRVDGPSPSGMRALVSYRTEAFLLPAGHPSLRTHTNFWQSAEMSAILAALGFTVDVIDYRNMAFVPDGPYDLFIDVRHNMERLAGQCGTDCLRIFHIDTAHINHSNANEAARLRAVVVRRGATLQPRRWERPNLGIEHAHFATGNAGAYALSTFKPFGKRIFPLPAPVEPDGRAPHRDWGSACKRFLWFGSGGMVHKGLDLTLEAFAGMPDLQLTVCGPVDKEPDFAAAYQRELYETPNIRTAGWLSADNAALREIMMSNGFLVYPSCSEGLSTSTVECMHAGLVPVISPETGVPADGFGFTIRGDTPGDVRLAVRAAAAQDEESLAVRSAAVTSFARKHHTRQAFSTAFRNAIVTMLSLPRPDAVPHARRAALAIDG